MTTTLAPPIAAPPTQVSVIVPTYHEVANLPHLIARLAKLRDAASLDLELILMDDDSNDGSDAYVRNCGRPWVRLVNRKGRPRGLSPAVIDGFDEARFPLIVVMDADLSHPPEAIPEMLQRLDAGDEFVLGSRYVEGGSTDDDWGLFRWINSRVATLLSRPLTHVSDPMSGFFAMHKNQIPPRHRLNPVGYKIALELIVKARLSRISEVPIHFADRTLGYSKLSLKEQLRFIQHLSRLYVDRLRN